MSRILSLNQIAMSKVFVVLILIIIFFYFCFSDFSSEYDDLQFLCFCLLEMTETCMVRSFLCQGGQNHGISVGDFVSTAETSNLNPSAARPFNAKDVSFDTFSA